MALRIAAILLAANAVILVLGVLTAGGRPQGTPERPAWLPPLWLRAAIPLVVALGLWFGQPWAWWIAVPMSALMLAWSALSVSMLALGGFFSERTGSRAVYMGSMTATWVGVLALLLA